MKVQTEGHTLYSLIMGKRRKKSDRKLPRSGVAIGMFQRFAHTGGPMKDRRVPRGGSKNHEREYRDLADE